MVTARKRTGAGVVAVLFALAAGSQSCAGRERTGETRERDSTEVAPATDSTEIDSTRAVDLVEVGGPGRLAVLEAPSEQLLKEQFIGEFDHSSSLRGSLGPYLFVLTQTFTYACGAAHPARWAMFDIVNARTGGKDSLLSLAGLARMERDLLPAAVAVFNSPDSEEVFNADSATLTALLPSFTEGRLALSYQFTASTSYAGSDGLWSSYTRSVMVPGREVPEALRDYEGVPQPVQDFWRASPPGEAAGWSQHEGDRATRLLAAEFRVRDQSAGLGGPTYLVWSGNDSARTTVWIGAAPSGFVEIGRHEGVYLAEGERVWSWRERRVQIVTVRCPTDE